MQTNELTDRARITRALDRMAIESVHNKPQTLQHDDHGQPAIAWQGGNWICCQSCGGYELSERGHEHYVFWHEQNEEHSFGVLTGRRIEDPDDPDMTLEEIVFVDNLQRPLMIYFSDVYAAGEAVRYLREEGLEVIWSGNGNEAIQVNGVASEDIKSQ